MKQTHDKKSAEPVTPITKKLEETEKYTENLGEIIEKLDSENENHQEIVPIENCSDISEDENIDNQSKIRVLPNSSYFSNQQTKNLGASMKSSSSLGKNSTPSGQKKRSSYSNIGL